MNIKEQIETLVKLQEIETNSNIIKSMLNEVYSKFEKLDVGLKEFEKTMRDEEILLDELKKKYREHEADIQITDSNIQKIEEKRRSVKTNKEYQSLLKEEEQLKDKKSKIEDEMLEFLESIEGSENVITSKKKEYTQLAERVNNEKEEIKLETDQGKKKLAQLNKEGVAVSENIESELLFKFNMLKEKQAGGIAIAPVKGAVCLGCNMNIPPQTYNELQRFDSLKFCPYCQRIIYWEEA